MELLITLGIITALIFIGLIFYTNSKRKKVSDGDQKRIKKHWSEILSTAQSNPTAAILEADKLLDEALKIKGYSGSLGEKLKAAAPLFNNRNGVWTAHKLRNRLAHKLNAKLETNEAKNALQQFKNALKDLGIKI